MDIPYVQNFPIAPLTNIMSVEYESIVQRLIEITISQKTVYQDFLTWLQIQYKVKKLLEN